MFNMTYQDDSEKMYHKTTGEIDVLDWSRRRNYIQSTCYLVEDIGIFRHKWCVEEHIVIGVEYKFGTFSYILDNDRTVAVCLTGDVIFKSYDEAMKACEKKIKRSKVKRRDSKMIKHLRENGVNV